EFWKANHGKRNCCGNLGDFGVDHSEEPTKKACRIFSRWRWFSSKLQSEAKKSQRKRRLSSRNKVFGRLSKEENFQGIGIDFFGAIIQCGYKRKKVI
ncbi:hypothetical protein U1Q18_012033, partial [Sarracenia purpurea var. burkii]